MIRVLIVDDEHLVRGGLKLILEAQPDIDVVGEAGDGAEAVTAAKALQPDVILLDVQMPVMNGLEAARAIRALEAERGAARTPILALSADALDDVGLPDELDGWVTKPVAVAVLVGAIEAALAGRARAA
jgi:DNA-binding NarL/FixJ family response regulator